MRSLHLLKSYDYFHLLFSVNEVNAIDRFLNSEQADLAFLEKARFLTIHHHLCTAGFALPHLC